MYDFVSVCMLVPDDSQPERKCAWCDFFGLLFTNQNVDISS